jgi:hypothetical protein
VHFFTGVSFGVGQMTSLWTVRIWQQPHSSHLLSQQSLWQTGVTGGRHIHLHVQPYLWIVSFFTSQVMWQQGSMQQPQRGQRSLQQPLHIGQSPRWHPCGQQPCSQQPVSAPRAGVCVANEPTAKIASPINPIKKRVIV